MATTKISWCDKVWNPVTGCTKVSEGCRNCYAARMATRLQAMGQPHYKNGFAVTCHDDALDIPLHWRKPAKIFVNSMSDLFHKDVPSLFIANIFSRMFFCNRHTFMILTKRPERMLEWINTQQSMGCYWEAYKNIWLGVSVENQKSADERIPLLLQTPAAVRFLSCEPLLGSLDLSRYLSGKLHMIIVGGESGPHCRPMNPDWARSLRDQCREASVPFFFKQAGGLHHGSDLLDGVEYKEFPK